MSVRGNQHSVEDKVSNTDGFDLVPGQVNDAIQRPSCICRCLAIALCLFDFLICEQQIDVTAMHEIDIVCPSVVLDETHEGR